MERPIDTWLNRGVGAVTLWAAIGGSSILGSLLARTAGLPTQSVIAIAVGSGFAAIGVFATAAFITRRIRNKQPRAMTPAAATSSLETYLIERLKEYDARERREREALRGADSQRPETAKPVKRVASPTEIAHEVFAELDLTRRTVGAIEGAVFCRKDERFHWLLEQFELPPYPERSGEISAEDRLGRVRALVWYYNEEMIRRGGGGSPEQKELYDPWAAWPKTR